MSIALQDEQRRILSRMSLPEIELYIAMGGDVRDASRRLSNDDQPVECVDTRESFCSITQAARRYMQGRADRQTIAEAADAIRKVASRKGTAFNLRWRLI